MPPISDTNVFGEKFRTYDHGPRTEIVHRLYDTQHSTMTVAKVKELRGKWLPLRHGEHTVWEVLELLDTLVDESDPDVDFPNSIHNLQAAEAARKAYPDRDWLCLAALLHDLGKVMSVWGEEQCYVVGDTFPVGCAFDTKRIVHPDAFAVNPDLQDPRYNTPLGIYEEGCGLDKLLMAWGHDEYMHEVLRGNGCSLPEVALRCIRFHSFYPWHSENAYRELCTREDLDVTLPMVRTFNTFDLYSKGDEKPPSVEEVKPFYDALLDKYGIGGKLRW